MSSIATLLIEPFPVNTEIHIQTKKFHFPKALETKVNHLWQSAARSYHIDAPILSITDIHEASMRGIIRHYRYFFAQNFEPKLFKKLQIRPLAVSGLLTCNDGLVIGRRSKILMQYPGCWELVPSGGIDTQDVLSTQVLSDLQEINAHAPLDLKAQILRELEEELGIEQDSLTDIKPFCRIHDLQSHVIDIGIALHASLSSRQIMERHSKIQEKEYDELLIVPFRDLGKWTSPDTPLIEASVQLLRWHLDTHITLA